MSRWMKADTHAWTAHHGPSNETRCSSLCRSSPLAGLHLAGSSLCRFFTPCLRSPSRSSPLATSSARDAEYLIVGLRVRPVGHQAQSLAIALRSPATERSSLNDMVEAARAPPDPVSLCLTPSCRRRSNRRSKHVFYSTTAYTVHSPV